ncbi:MAG TPA: hypothetical protein VFQ81_08595 [Candidatus Limnocylindria bacterium]|nr:hypothetical protein [Candidatus Limnocylindria bacterium]
MTAPRDPDRLIGAFLSEGEERLDDQVYDAVRARIEQTRQRAVLGPWRTPTMNKIATFGFAAAAVVIAVFLGAQLLGSPSRFGGPGPVPTTSPEISDTRSPSPTPAAVLPEGLFALTDGRALDGMPTLSTTVTVPAPGWYGEPGGAILVKNDNSAAPDGAGMIAFFGELYVYADPCQWATTRPDLPVSTVDELMEALAAQASRDASEPVDITLDGHTGQSVILHVPDDAVFTECDQGTFGSWGVPGADRSPFRYHQDPGQIDEVWAVDVDGVLTVIDVAYYDGTPQAVRDEMRAIVESVTFE